MDLPEVGNTPCSEPPWRFGNLSTPPSVRPHCLRVAVCGNKLVVWTPAAKRAPADLSISTVARSVLCRGRTDWHRPVLGGHWSTEYQKQWPCEEAGCAVAAAADSIDSRGPMHVLWKLPPERHERGAAEGILFRQPARIDPKHKSSLSSSLVLPSESLGIRKGNSARATLCRYSSKHQYCHRPRRRIVETSLWMLLLNRL